MRDEALTSLGFRFDTHGLHYVASFFWYWVFTIAKILVSKLRWGVLRLNLLLLHRRHNRSVILSTNPQITGVLSHCRLGQLFFWFNQPRIFGRSLVGAGWNNEVASEDDGRYGFSELIGDHGGCPVSSYSDRLMEIEFAVYESAAPKLLIICRGHFKDLFGNKIMIR